MVNFFGKLNFISGLNLVSALLVVVTVASCTSSSAPPASQPAAKTDPSSGGGGDNSDPSAGSPDGGIQGPAPDLGPTLPTTGNKSNNANAYIASKDPNCQSSAACPPANLALLVPQAGQALSGTTGQTVTWKFVGYDQNSASRHVAVILSGLPDQATLDPLLSMGNPNGTVTLTWTPVTAGKNTIGIILRDFDRCAVTEAANGVCISTTFNPIYDKQLPPVNYNITAASSPSSACPSGGILSNIAGATKPVGC